ncbi:protein of unknown function DUF152 [Alkaliphilus metalliredigens QYMF]|uniref:Purine nucleoside phosphorylase n=1 Tax=Alkaliphilus metalliredigens (strain QYMF) TaxID=293826 RepID=A6TS49_ALKMQ|nr:peptidoglycan editing factor PgeF [Alkaliphilus metalliredigens]ABR49017.1 protein of unknown function DUF152 [Alkaliphilus metalliredigens QYMF]
MSFVQIIKEGVTYFEIEAFQQFEWLKHGFSTRIGGKSEGPYDSLNLGRKTKDDYETVIENTKHFCEAVGINPSQVQRSNQVHGDQIKIVGESCKTGDGTDGFDGMITNQRGVPLMTYYADCVPLFFVDPDHRVVATTHGGWRGTQMKIAQKTVKKMMTHFGTNPQNVIVAIGPSIGPCCYEVNKEVIDEFNTNFTQTATFVKPMGEGKYMLDLWRAHIVALKEIGVQDRNIITSGLCTACRTDLFYSHRKEKGVTGRMAALIQLK